MFKRCPPGSTSLRSSHYTLLSVLNCRFHMNSYMFYFLSSFLPRSLSSCSHPTLDVSMWMWDKHLKLHIMKMRFMSFSHRPVLPLLFLWLSLPFAQLPVLKTWVILDSPLLSYPVGHQICHFPPPSRPL